MAHIRAHVYIHVGDTHLCNPHPHTHSRRVYSAHTCTHTLVCTHSFLPTCTYAHTGTHLCTHTICTLTHTPVHTPTHINACSFTPVNTPPTPAHTGNTPRGTQIPGHSHSRSPGPPAFTAPSPPALCHPIEMCSGEGPSSGWSPSTQATPSRVRDS